MMMTLSSDEEWIDVTQDHDTDGFVSGIMVSEIACFSFSVINLKGHNAQSQEQRQNLSV